VKIHHREPQKALPCAKTRRSIVKIGSVNRGELYMARRRNEKKENKKRKSQTV